MFFGCLEKAVGHLQVDGGKRRPKKSNYWGFPDNHINFYSVLFEPEEHVREFVHQ